jgi:hypothetical protein
MTFIKMKISKVILFVFSVLAMSASAQTNKFNFGIEAGPSITSLRGSVIRDNTSMTSYNTGIAFQYNFKYKLALHVNLAFERKGTDLGKTILTDEHGTVIAQGNHYFYFDYLTLPVMLRGSFIDIGRRGHIFINAGPYWSFLVKESDVIKAGGATLHQFEYTAFFDKLDIGISSGAGFTITAKKLLLSFEVRNNRGLSNIQQSNIGSLKTNSTIFLLGVNYKFGIKEKTE